MLKVNFNKYIFKIILAIILLLSTISCVYAVGHYKSNNTTGRNNKFIMQESSNNKDANREGNNSKKVNTNNGNTSTNSSVNGQSISQDSASSNGTDQSNNKGQNQDEGMPQAPLDENMQGGPGQNAPPQSNNNGQDGVGGNTISNSNENSQGGSTKNNRSQQNKNTKFRQRPNGQQGQHGNMQQGMHMGSVSTKYLPALTAYAVIFLILSIGIYYLFKRKNVNVTLTDEKMIIFTVLAVGFLLRITLGTIFEGHNDLNLFKNWATNAANGFSTFYSNSKSADYPPLYIYVLGIIGKVADMSAFNPYYSLLLKLPAIIADVVTSYFIYRLGKKYLSPEISILISVFYLFNPAIFIDSTLWGQVDSFFAMFIMFALFLLNKKKIVLSSAVFAAAVLMKPQGIIFLPILFFELVMERNLKAFIKAAVSAIITAIIIILPFSLNQQSPLWIFKLYSSTISEYPYASVNAFNFFSLLGANYKNDTDTLFILNYHTIGMMFIVVVTLISWAIYIRGKKRAFIFAIALLQIAGVFTFATGMHERYLFPAVALALFVYIYLKDRRFFLLAIGFSVTSYINISTVLFSLNSSYFNIVLKLS